MPRSVGETQLKNTTLEVMLLPRGSRAVTEVLITNTALATEGSTTMQLSASVANTQVRAGTSLSFIPTSGTNTRRRQALVVEDVVIGAAATPVQVASLIDNIPALPVATFVPGLVPVFGLQGFSLQSQDQTVDTTDTQSGAGTESAIVRSGLDFTINCIERVADYGLTGIVKEVGLNFGLKGREVYAVLTYPDGEVHKGAAKVMNYSQPGNQNEVKRANFTLQFQGESYKYIKAYNFDGSFTATPPTTPTSFDTTLTVATTGTAVEAATVSFNSNAGNVMRFNAMDTATGSALPATMTFRIGGTEVGRSDFTQRYLGQPYSVTIAGTTYTPGEGFKSGDVNL